MDLLRFKNLKQIVGLFVLVVFYSCSNDYVENRNSGSALGTTYSIIYYDSVTQDYQKEIDSVFAVINQSMSTYIPTSDISRINVGDTTIVVDAMFQEVFNLSKDVFKTSKGYFDPTVGVLVNAWGFGPGKQIELDSIKIDSLLNYVGFDKVSLNANKTITKANPNILFDFNAIAKGYAVDRVGAFLDGKGIKNYLIEVGGELTAKGENKIKNKKFVVGIDDPKATDRSVPVAKINLNNKALASSGNYRHFRADTITGKIYVHTINPFTGYTQNSNVLGVSVLANTCAEADAYATAFMAMDLDDSMALLLGDDTLEAFIIYVAVNGEIIQFKTDGFNQIIID
jgi:thiamine biosynthesis lipoprotein